MSFREALRALGLELPSPATPAGNYVPYVIAGNMVYIAGQVPRRDGKVAIPDAILEKPGPLSAEDWRFLYRHTLIAERILAGAPDLAKVAGIVRWTHERVDGTGYPDGLKGDEIPLAARIVFVCDAFDAMISNRPYAEALTIDAALEELRRCAGTQFDPEVSHSFCEGLDDYREAEIGKGNKVPE